MNKERLTSLAIHMRHYVEPENFDMVTWFKYPPSFFAHRRPIGKQINMCGTTACIAGHAYALFRPDTPAGSPAWTSFARSACSSA